MVVLLLLNCYGYMLWFLNHSSNLPCLLAKNKVAMGLIWLSCFFGYMYLYKRKRRKPADRAGQHFLFWTSWAISYNLPACLWRFLPLALACISCEPLYLLPGLKSYSLSQLLASLSNSGILTSSAVLLSWTYCCSRPWALQSLLHICAKRHGNCCNECQVNIATKPVKLIEQSFPFD